MKSINKAFSNNRIQKQLHIGRFAFTLAEIMVVLFVMSIILAAFAPMITTRTKVNKTSPWEWATPDSANTYFGANANQRVLIGQKTQGEDRKAKLTINSSADNIAHILLKRGSKEISVLTTDGANNYIWSDFSERDKSTHWNNIIIGYQAMKELQEGTANTIVGTDAFASLINGHANTAIGFRACANMDHYMWTTCLGAESGPGPHSNEVNNTVYIGNEHSTVNILGDLNVGGYLNAESSNITSDARLKNVKSENSEGLEKIKQIKPVNFTFKDDKKQTPRVGVLAQELQKIFPNAVTKGTDGYLRIRQEDMFYAMINSIKELAYKDDAKNQKIKALEKKNAELEARIEKLEKNLSKKENK